MVIIYWIIIDYIEEYFDPHTLILLHIYDMSKLKKEEFYNIPQAVLKVNIIGYEMSIKNTFTKKNQFIPNPTSAKLMAWRSFYLSFSLVLYNGSTSVLKQVCASGSLTISSPELPLL